MNFLIPKKLTFFYNEKARYKIAYGGRGAGKTENICAILILLALSSKKRILCTREYQSSIKDSVHYVLEQLIYEYNLQDKFNITKTEIRCLTTGSDFIFKGMQDMNSLKSLGRIDICFVEEAAKIAKEKWEKLIPTIRQKGSEIWVALNPELDRDDTYRRFIKNKLTNSIVQKVNYNDNPFFNETELPAEMELLKQNDYEAYLNVWEGQPIQRSALQVFSGKYKVEDFETPPLDEMDVPRFFYGGDWGFVDPTAFIRCFMWNGCLYVDYEAVGVRVELEKTENPPPRAKDNDYPNNFAYLEELFNSIPESKRWEIKADSANPDKISLMRNKGFRIVGTKKKFLKDDKKSKEEKARQESDKKSYIEAGISYLRGKFKHIIIHSRCKSMAMEFDRYSYKEDKNTGEPLPEIQDIWNHCIDALRYSIDSYIQGKVSTLEARRMRRLKNESKNKIILKSVTL